MAWNGHSCLTGSLDVPPHVSYGSAMAIRAGRHPLGADIGRVTLRTFRDGLVAQAGHDLTIDAVRWSGELVVADDLSPASLQVTVDLGALVVREGTGGIKPLTERDKREIAVSARKVLSADRYPEATFTATSFEPAADGGTITGTLALACEVPAAATPGQPDRSGCLPRHHDDPADRFRHQAILSIPWHAQGRRRRRGGSGS